MILSLGITPKNFAPSGTSYDADAQTYFTANTSITSAADKTAISDFYAGLKTDGIYTKVKTMYLTIWGSAATCKWNLVNPLDTDAAFRLNFTTGWTYASTGITPNGTSAYADTFLTPSVTLNQNSAAFGAYSRTIGQNTGVIIGCQTSTPTYIRIVPRNTTNSCITGLNQGTNDTTANSDGTGFYQISRTGSTNYLYGRNSTITTITRSSTNTINQKVWIGANNNVGTGGTYSNKELTFIYIADGLTSTDLTNFYNRVQTLMTYFGINI